MAHKLKARQLPLVLVGCARATQKIRTSKHGRHCRRSGEMLRASYRRRSLQGRGQSKKIVQGGSLWREGETAWRTLCRPDSRRSNTCGPHRGRRALRAIPGKGPAKALQATPGKGLPRRCFNLRPHSWKAGGSGSTFCAPLVKKGHAWHHARGA